jgi:hypothetical protein
MNPPHDLSSIIGSWSLISYSTENLLGHFIAIQECQIGSLNYSSEGRVSLKIERDPAMLTENNLDSEIAHISYSGRFAVDRSRHEVKHFIERSNRLDRIGSILTRTFELVGNRLVIKGCGLRGPVVLEWIRRANQADSSSIAAVGDEVIE